MRPDVERFLLDYAAAHSKSLGTSTQAILAFQDAYDYLGGFIKDGAGLSADDAKKLHDMLTRFRALKENADFLDEEKTDAVRQLPKAFLQPSRPTLHLPRPHSGDIHF